MALEVTHDVQIQKDDEGRARQLSHPLRPFTFSESGLEGIPSPRALADQYLQQIQSLINLPATATGNLSFSLESVPSDAGMDLRFKEEKKTSDSAAVTYAQARFGIPVWNAGLTVRMRTQPLEVTGAANAVHYDLELPEPSRNAAYLPEKIDGRNLPDLFPPGVIRDASINKRRLWIYKFDPDERIDHEVRAKPPSVAFEQGPPTLPLFPLPPSIKPAQHYVVTEVLFTMALPNWGKLNWRTFVEVETGAVLYVRALIACVGNGSVFPSDPVTLHGDACSAHATAAVLDALRVPVALSAAGPVPPQVSMKLKGQWVDLVDTQPPVAAGPTAVAPFDFKYSAKTDHFAAVSAYHHCDNLFRMVEGMGIGVLDYFDGTTFPVPVDHSALGGAVNAQAPGNESGNGSGGFLFGTAAPGTGVGIAADVRVVLHEFGHAILWDHVGSPNFGFAHSAGDSMAAILHDAGTQASDPSETFPFMSVSAGLSRRHDRQVEEGWAWGGPMSIDDRQYGTEQILSTTLFRVYQACGGDDPDIAVKRAAARYVVYLILKGVGLLSFTSRDPRVFANALIESDIGTINFEGHPGGALHKVIRWSFEKQGLFQPPGAPRPVMQPGAPPEVDVYIEDGRHGEYMPYGAAIADTPDVWNRHAPDGGHTHQPAIAGSPQFLYVRARNRGTSSASAVSARAYQAAAGTTEWPAGWTSLGAPLVAPGSIPSGGQVVLGPIPWVPGGANPRLLVSVSATGDPSNIDVVQGSLPVSRLVSTDNNLALKSA
ncbi:MAG TPA: hypothetical protein VL175_10825 [Pirellulales bacterium]|nr:hypothetical protein [Pirellulales bacterium]